MNTDVLLKAAKKTLVGANARFGWQGDEEDQAWDILAFVLGRDPDRDAELSRADVKRFEKLLKQRTTGEPLAYILGWVDFLDFKMTVKRGAFIPRLTSEWLAKSAVKRLRGRKDPVHVDLATGIGPVPIAVARAVPKAQVFGVDIDKDAIKLAKLNAKKLGAPNATFLVGNMFDPLPARVKGKVNVVTIHPPYVPNDEVEDLPEEIKRFEKRTTLTDGSPDGLGLVRKVTHEGRDWLAPGGLGARRDRSRRMEPCARDLQGRRIHRHPQHARRPEAHAGDLRKVAIAPPTREVSTDVVIVGAGHNGLICAAYLARQGLRVSVYEKRSVVGGATVTEELAPGFRVSTASYALSLLRPDVFAELELERHGLIAVPKDPQMFVPASPDVGGLSFFVWRDTARTQAELSRIHPPDAEAYEAWCVFWDDAVDVLRPLVDSPVAVDPKTYLSDRGRIDLYERCVVGSAAELVESFFEHPAVQGAFASQGIIGTWASVRDPGTAWVMAYHAVGGDLYGSKGAWGFVRGGMGAVSASIAAAAREAGAALFRNSPATEILVDDGGRAVGVRLANGLAVRARYVISGADPKTTFLRLCPDGSLPPEFRERVEAWSTPGCVLKVNLALSELPDLVARPGKGPQHHGTIEISPSIDHLHEAYTDAQTTGHSARPYMEVFVQSVLDPSLVDGAGHVVSAFTQYVGPKTFDASVSRDHATEAVLRTLGAYAPNVPDAVVAIDALGPVELEERFGLAGGDIFHGSLLPEQCFDKRFDHRTPLPGLYLCGSGSRPGGCVMGASGRNAARTVIEDLTGA